MADWFSQPIVWKTNMTVTTDTENRMLVSIAQGPIEIKALYDGFMIYRQKSEPSGSARGNVELVLLPDKWPKNIQEFFNPRFPKRATTSGISELPPGRVVYLDLAEDVVKQGLHRLILEKFNAYRTDPTKDHRVLDFIPDLRSGPTLLLKTLRFRLLEVWNTTSDDSERQVRIAAEIDNAIDAVVFHSASDTLRALPIRGADLLCTLGSSTSSANVSFEIRNLYGEPLNPHFYLRKLGRTPTELAPTPPFPNTEPLSRIKPTDQFLAIRIPKDGGVEFNELKVGVPPYQSALVWNHNYDPATGSHSTGLEPRPGRNVEVPKLDSKVQSRVDKIWDTHFFHINKHAEIFQVPCELIVSTIYKEARPTATGFPDLHSIRIEPKNPSAPFPTDYESLLTRSKESGSLLTRETLDAYWKAVGEWATNSNGLNHEPRQKTIAPKKYPKVTPVIPFQAKAPIGTSELLKQIKWAQLAEMVEVKPELITTNSIPLPVLGKTKAGKYHYELLKNASGLGPDVASVYWLNVGGIRLNEGKEELSELAPVTLVSFPLPIDWIALVDPTHEDPNTEPKAITGEQLLMILNLLTQAGVKDIPKATYTLQPLQTTGTYAYLSQLIRATIKPILGIGEEEADLIVIRFYGLMNKGLVFESNVGPAPGEEGVRKESKPGPDEYLTLSELKAVSQACPELISIGVGQILFETARRLVIPWVKKHYGGSFFINDLAVDEPPDNVDRLIPWIWDNLWDNEEAQIALIAAYHKQNATMFWQAITDGKGNRYKVGETMTKFDFPRVAAAYNAGIVRKAFLPRDADHPDVDWGLHTFGDYFAPSWSAVTYAITRFVTTPPGDPKEARVRLRPDLEADSGMDPR